MASQEEDANKKRGLFSRLSFNWVGDLVKEGARAPLEPADMMHLPENDTPHHCFDVLNEHWNKEKERPNPSLLRAFRLSFGPFFYSAIPLKFIHDSCLLSGPLFFKEIIKYFETTSTMEDYEGFMYIGFYFLTLLVIAVFINQYFFISYRAGIRVRGAIMSVVYEKALHLSRASRQALSVGRITNLMSVDAEKMQFTMAYLHTLWSAPFQIVVALVLLYREVGWSTFAGFFMMIIIMPLQSKLAQRVGKLREKTTAISDKRIRMTNEVIQHIKAIKFNVWEPFFFQEVGTVRRQEMKRNLKIYLLNALNVAIFTSANTVVALVTFAIYVLVADEELTAAKAFTSISLFSLLRFPLGMIPMLIASVIDANVSFKRIRAFLFMDELDPEAVKRSKLFEGESGSDFEEVVSVKDGSFRWKPELEIDSSLGFNETKLLSPEEKKLLKAKEKQLLKERKNQKQLQKSGNSSHQLEPVVSENSANPESNEIENVRNTLQDIQFSVKKGELLMICGPVGCGKTSVLAALLGELDPAPGLKSDVHISGDIAYVNQQPWILNATFKENILFGKPFEEEWYNEVIRVCALEEDLKVLPGGHNCEIGEKGINLSGGQRARLALGRAVYSRADVYLLDDPISAVDAHVAKHLVEECLTTALAGRTRILTTNQLQWAHVSDRILSLTTHGEIAELGTYEELMSRVPAEHGSGDDHYGAFYQLVTTFIHQVEKEKPDEERTDVGATLAQVELTVDSDENKVAAIEKELMSPPIMAKQVPAYTDAQNEKSDEKEEISEDVLALTAAAKGKLTTKEDRQTGEIEREVYMRYTKLSGGWVWLFFLIVVGAVTQVLRVMTDYWVSYWTDENEEAKVSNTENDHPLGFYLGIYGAFVVSVALFVFVRSIVIALGAFKSSVRMHDAMFSSVVHSPSAFFDTTPVGRILNRFSSDTAKVDTQVPQNMGSFIATAINVLGVLIVAITVAPIMTVVIIPVIFVYQLLMQRYRKSSREIKRIESISRSPIYAHFGETLTGLSTIRAFERQTAFAKENKVRIDENSRAMYTQTAAYRWLDLRLQLLGTIVILFTLLYVVWQRSHFTASIIGFLLNNLSQITGLMTWLVRQAIEFETNMTSIQRIFAYSDLEGEPAYERPEDKPLLDSDWPQKGDIVFDKISMRYREKLPLVLKDVSFKITGGEKIGVVGRTGSGKSSLLMILFRLVDTIPPSTIFIDGKDIKTIGLKALRSSLAIIPQDPVLFSGTIRTNLDPDGRYSDEEIWTALARVRLRESVQEMPGQLNGIVAEYGENLSTGQRQLVCLARALLRNCQIILMDEGTAAVDVETDSIIQRTIRSAFATHTVLTIAHRLNTIIDCDRILVMDNGHVAELDTPAALLDNPDGIFTALVERTGPRSALNLRAIANGHASVFDRVVSSSSLPNLASEDTPAN